MASSPLAFAPIAIVGRACVLPGALSPEALWAAVSGGRDLLTRAPAGRWRLSEAHALCAPDAPRPDRTWSDRGGYVSGFDAIWNADGFAIPARELAGLDPLVHCLLHCSRAALAEVANVPVVGRIKARSDGSDNARQRSIVGSAALDPTY